MELPPYLFCLILSFIFFPTCVWRQWAAFLGAWCPLLAFRSCFVEFTQRWNVLLMNLSGIKWSPHPIPLPSSITHLLSHSFCRKVWTCFNWFLISWSSQACLIKEDPLPSSIWSLTEFISLWLCNWGLWLLSAYGWSHSQMLGATRSSLPCGPLHSQFTSWLLAYSRASGESF